MERIHRPTRVSHLHPIHNFIKITKSPPLRSNHQPLAEMQTIVATRLCRGGLQELVDVPVNANIRFTKKYVEQHTKKYGNNVEHWIYDKVSTMLADIDEGKYQKTDKINMSDRPPTAMLEYMKPKPLVARREEKFVFAKPTRVVQRPKKKAPRRNVKQAPQPAGVDTAKQKLPKKSVPKKAAAKRQAKNQPEPKPKRKAVRRSRKNKMGSGNGVIVVN